jgi:hypothetical protein
MICRHMPVALSDGRTGGKQRTGELTAFRHGFTVEWVWQKA